MSNHRRNNKRGFVLAEYIIAVLIVITFIPILVICIRLNMNALRFHEETQDEIAIAQLRKIMNVGTHFEVSSNIITFEYHEEPYHLYLVNHHLILSPGTQIFLSEVDQLSFSMRGNYIYCDYERKNQTYSRVLTHV